MKTSQFAKLLVLLVCAFVSSSAFANDAASYDEGGYEYVEADADTIVPGVPGAFLDGISAQQLAKYSRACGTAGYLKKSNRGVTLCGRSAARFASCMAEKTNIANPGPCHCGNGRDWTDLECSSILARCGFKRVKGTDPGCLAPGSIQAYPRTGTKNGSKFGHVQFVPWEGAIQSVFRKPIAEGAFPPPKRDRRGGVKRQFPRTACYVFTGRHTAPAALVQAPTAERAPASISLSLIENLFALAFASVDTADATIEMSVARMTSEFLTATSETTRVRLTLKIAEAIEYANVPTDPSKARGLANALLQGSLTVLDSDFDRETVAQLLDLRGRAPAAFDDAFAALAPKDRARLLDGMQGLIALGLAAKKDLPVAP